MWRLTIAALIVATGCAGDRHEKRDEVAYPSPPSEHAHHSGKSSGGDDAGGVIGDFLGSILGAIFSGGGDDSCAP